jgi:hypothetical protein
MAGRLPSPEQTEKRFWAGVDTSGDCWVWTRARGGYSGNYGVFSHGKRHGYAHRFSFALAYGEIPEGLYVCHRCNNGLCVKPDHLYLGTAAENSRDAVRDGLIARGVHSSPFKRNARQVAEVAPPIRLSVSGTSNVRARLNEDKVKEIRRLVDGGHATRTEVAQQFGIGRSTVRLVVNRITWRHVPEDACIQEVN